MYKNESVLNITVNPYRADLKRRVLLISLRVYSYLGLVGWWSTSSSPWPSWRVSWTDWISIVILWRLLARLPLLLWGRVSPRMSPCISLGIRVERLASRVRRVWGHCRTTFTVVRVWSNRISWTLRVKGRKYVLRVFFSFFS